ncbi:MAG: hypothetical protein NVS2B4_16770 [Ramlibacter sp.]
MAGLPLPPQRSLLAAQLLASWLPAPNALSRKMSEPQYAALLPATVFVHPAADQES